MSQFNVPVRRAGGGPDVYTCLLLVATVLLAAAVANVAMVNIKHSDPSGGGGGQVTKILQETDLGR